MRMFAAFTYRDFRVQWFGACTSSIGTWMQIVAQNWLVLSLTHSAFFLGLDAFLQQLPIILFSLAGGVLADRRDRRRTLLASQYVQMATSAVLAALMYFQVVQIWHILTLSFVTGIAQSFGGPAYQSLIPSLVDKKDLPNAVALNSIQFNLARVLGPLLFAATLAAFTRWGYAEPQAMNACFLLNSLSFLVGINTRMALRGKLIPLAHAGGVRVRSWVLGPGPCGGAGSCWCRRYLRRRRQSVRRRCSRASDRPRYSSCSRARAPPASRCCTHARPLLSGRRRPRPGASPRD